MTDKCHAISECDSQPGNYIDCSECSYWYEDISGIYGRLKYENELDDLREFVEMVKWWAECEDFLFRGASKLKINPWGEFIVIRIHAERAICDWLKEHGHD